MKDRERKRITITCYDDEGFDLILHVPLQQFVETTKETGFCVCRCTGDRMIYIEETKVGYAIRAWKERRE